MVIVSAILKVSYIMLLLGKVKYPLELNSQLALALPVSTKKEDPFPVWATSCPIPWLI